MAKEIFSLKSCLTHIRVCRGVLSVHVAVFSERGTAGFTLFPWLFKKLTGIILVGNFLSIVMKE